MDSFGFPPTYDEAPRDANQTVNLTKELPPTPISPPPLRPKLERDPEKQKKFERREFLEHKNALDEALLVNLLSRLSWKLLAVRGAKTSLIVHGGIISVLGSRHRRSTTDVDYIARILPEELDTPVPLHRSVKRMLRTCSCSPEKSEEEDLSDANVIIRLCIAEVANDFNKQTDKPFNLEKDWMNSDADVALPWYLDEQMTMYDPISTAAFTATNILHNTVFDSPGLRLIAIPGMWTLALKLQRWTPPDEFDIGQLLATSDNVPEKYTEQEFAFIVKSILRKDYNRTMDYEHFPDNIAEEWNDRILVGVHNGRLVNLSYLRTHGLFEQRRAERWSTIGEKLRTTTNNDSCSCSDLSLQDLEYHY